jgi:ferritin-like metal-binding protein YciE
MAYTLEQFAAECHRILKADAGAAGQQKVCALLQDVLKDDAFVAANLGDGRYGCRGGEVARNTHQRRLICG